MKSLAWLFSTVFCLGLVCVPWTSTAAQLNRYGQTMHLQGTCLDSGGCNSQQQWQYLIQNPDGCQYPDCGLPLGNVDTNLVLTGEERQSLIFMREEEKLARDLYLGFYQQWGTPAFANIAAAEQQHMDTVWMLMQKYGIPDSATETIGTFNDSSLQTLYADLFERGSVSQAEALFSGGFVEEADIEDLQNYLATTIENPAVSTAYSHLQNASEQHLRSFVANIENLGFVYAAQILSTEQLDEILNGENEQGGYAVGGNRFQHSDARFLAVLSSDAGRYGNRATFTQQERLNLGMLVFPDRNHVGQTADLFMVAIHVPEGSREALMFMRNEENEWQVWNGDVAALVVAQARQLLTWRHRMTIHQGVLQIPGHFQVMVGYRLQDGTLVLAGTPVEFDVQ